MRQVFADAGLQEEFSNRGYVKVPWLAPSEVAAVLAQLSALRPDDNFAPEATYHCSFLDTNLEYKRQTHGLIQQAFGGQIQDVLDDFRLLNGNFYVKPPGTGEFSVHQNWPAVTDLDDTTVTVWCPLTDVVGSNGTLQVVAGSHKIVPYVQTPGCPTYFADFVDALLQDYLEPVEMTAGEALIFDDSLIHWSARNDSGQPRIAIQALCIPGDATPAFFFKADEQRFEVIHADCEFFTDQGPGDLQSRQPHWKSLGFIDNPNRPVSEHEFAELLRRGNTTRAALDRPPVADARPRRNWFGRWRPSRS